MADERIELPVELADRLRGFERRLRGAETLIAFFGTICGVLAAYAVVFLSDRVWDTPPALRVALAGTAGLFVTGAVIWWLRHWRWRRRDIRELAKLVQRHYPRMGDRLLGAVELANGGGASALAASPALCRAAIRQVAAECGGYDFKAAVETRRPRRLAQGSILLALPILAALYFAPEAAHNALTRWMRPLAGIDRFTFVSLAAMPDRLVVAHGEPFEIACALAGRSRWKPETATARIADQPRIDARFAGGRAVFRVPGQTRKGTLQLRIGDVLRRIAVEPVYRPELLEFAADVTWPEYLERPPARVPVRDGRAAFLAGSRVRFEGRAARALSSAVMTNGTPRRLEVTGDRFRTPAGSLETWMGPAATNAPGEGAVTIAFAWTDRHALAGAAPYRLELARAADAAPVLSCEGLAPTVAILEDESVELKVRASDDFGVRRLWVEWTTTFSGMTSAKGLLRSVSLASGAPDCIETNGVFRFSPVARRVPEGASVELSVAALDYAPGRTPTRSAVYRIYVLSRAEHARLLRDRAQNVLAKLEELAREEERLFEKNLELDAADEAAKRGEKTAAELRESERGERINAAALERLARELAALAKEGLRNREVGAETLEEWTKLAQEMGELTDGSMPQTAQELQQASASEARRAEALRRALAAQRKTLEAMRRMERAANLSVENLAARSFVNRLRAAAQAETDLGETLKGLLPKIAGLPADALPEETRPVLGRLGDAQERTRREARTIRDDLGGFYNRTRKAEYDEVRRAMVEPDVDAELRKVGEGIAQNLSGVTIPESVRLAKKFNDWADRLTPPKKEDGGGGGGGGQKGMDIEALIALMRARVQEESLRENTRVLDEGRADNEHYGEGAVELAGRQRRIAKDVEAVKPRIKDGRIEQFVDGILERMAEGGDALQRPDTGTATIAIQTEIIELLSQSCQQGAEQAGAAAQQMMAMAQSQAGGGSRAGGTTDRANALSGGPADGAAGGDRKVETGGGADTGALPEEFRDTLEAYFRAVEGEK